MMMTRSFFFLFVAFCVATSAQAMDCSEGKRLIEQAKNATQDIPTRISLAEEAVAVCPSFASNLQLGIALFAKANLERSDSVALNAAQAFQQAFCLACSAKDKATALDGMGQVALAMEQKQKAAYLFRQANNQFEMPNVRERLRAAEEAILNLGSTSKDIGSVLTAEVVCRESPECVSKGAFSAQPIEKPSANVHIHFAYNSYELGGSAVAEAQALARALKEFESSNSAGKRRVHIIGHTDARGGDSYNQELSQRRAEAVKGYIVRTQGVSPSMLLAEGRGKSELLYPGSEENDHSLNRRVEVKVE